MSRARLWQVLKRLRMSRVFAAAGLVVLAGMVVASAFGPGRPAEQTSAHAAGRLEIVSLVEVLGKVGQETLSHANQVALASSSSVLGAQTEMPASGSGQSQVGTTTLHAAGSPYAGHWVQPPQPDPSPNITSPATGTEPSDPVHTPMCGGCGAHKYLGGHFCALYCQDQAN